MDTMTLRQRIHDIIFETDSRAGRAFDIALIIAICTGVVLAMLDSVATVSIHYHDELYIAEWLLTIIFTVEYILRIYSIHRPVKYIFSFFGIIDFLAIIPTYLSLLIPGTQALQVVRIFRLLRIFRIFKLPHYVGEAKMLGDAMCASRHKITVFLLFVAAAVVSVGSLMYVVEGPESGFTSIPMSVYWAIVTITTVGFGDMTPQTPIGQALASCLMIAGYGIIAVPTGIVSSELVRSGTRAVSTQSCRNCSAQGHDIEAKFCKYCASAL